MATTLERLTRERTFHDRQARARARAFAAGTHDLRFADVDYLRHESWIEPALACLGDLSGKQVLDYGCGHGMAAVVLARRGAQVTAFDLSGGYAAEAARRAHANGVRVQVVQANAEQLPFAQACFDAIWGNAILHHLDLRQAGREIHRVLRPGGVAVFCEPWGENPLLRLGRHLAAPGEHHTPDERPLRREDLAFLQAIFPYLETHGFQLFDSLRRLAPMLSRRLHLVTLDRMLLDRLPWCAFWCRYMVLVLKR